MQKRSTGLVSARGKLYFSGLIQKKHDLYFPSCAKIWVTYTKCTCLFVFVFIFCSHTIILKYGVLPIRQFWCYRMFSPLISALLPLYPPIFSFIFFLVIQKKSFSFFWSKESTPSTQQKGLISPQKGPPPKKGLPVCVFDPRCSPSKRNIPSGHRWGQKRSMVWNGGKNEEGGEYIFAVTENKKRPMIPFFV